MTWAKQIEREKQQDPYLSYIPLETVPLEPVYDSIYISHSSNTNNTYFFPNLEPLVIPYQADQPADSQLWYYNSSLKVLRKEILYGVYTRKLDRVPSTKVSTLYKLDCCSILH